MKLLVIKTSSYEFTDKNSGELIKGSKAQSIANVDGILEITPITFSNPGEAEKTFSVVPAIYDVTFDTIPAGKKFKTVFSGAKMIQKHEFPI